MFVLENRGSVTSGYAQYIRDLVRAGIQFSDPETSNIWKAVEPVIASLFHKYTASVGKSLIQILPCSPGEFYNRAVGMIDNMEERIAQAIARERAYQEKTAKFANQVNLASAALAQSIMMIEDLAIRLGHSFPNCGSRPGSSLFFNYKQHSQC